MPISGPRLVVLALALFCWRPVQGEGQSANQTAEWQVLNRQVVEAYQAGRAGDAILIAERVLAFARRAFGPRHPDTLRSMSNLAGLLHAQGRYDEAEPLLHETLQLRRETLGPRHPDTLNSMSNLAALLRLQGRYDEAEPLYRETLQLSRETLGPHNASTLNRMNHLAAVLYAQGRYGEAEPLYRETLQLSRETLGPRNASTLTDMNNLAALLRVQGRYDEAELLYRETLQLSRETLGPRDPNTLTDMNNLAELLLMVRGRHGEAEPLLRDTLQLRRETLGLRDPNTLLSMSHLAALLRLQGRYDEAELLYRETLQLSRETLGPRNASTLNRMNGLALLLRDQGRFDEAEPLLREALESDSKGLGASHPTTLVIQLNAVANLAAQGRISEAVALQREMEPQVLAWLGVELYSSEAASVRRHLVASQSTYQDMVLSLALLPDAGADAAELAASALLRFKGMAVEEEMYLARLVRRGEDTRIRAAAAEITQLHAKLARLFQGAGTTQEVASLTARLDGKELELGRISRDYAPHLQVRSASLEDLRSTLARLPDRSALLDIREYRPADFKINYKGYLGPSRWAGVLLTRDGEIQVRDLGATAETEPLVKAMLKDAASQSGAAAAQALHRQLLAPFAAELAKWSAFTSRRTGGCICWPSASCATRPVGACWRHSTSA